MKKLIVMALVAATSLVASAAYQVYEVKILGKTTKYGGTVNTSCGEPYAYRTGTTVTIKGILAGCGCAESIANGTCSGRVVAFWNETTKTPLVFENGNDGFTFRIGKKGEKVEQFSIMKFADTNDNWECEIYCAGFGSYKAHAQDPELDQMRISTGFFGGFMTAPLSKVSCTACGTTGGETTQVLGICGEACDSIDEGEYTAFGGKFAIAPNSKKAKACEQRGISRSILGIPSYASFEVGE